MNTFFNILKKSLVASMIMVFAFVVTYIPQSYNDHKTVQTVEAALPVIDFSNVIQTTVTALKTVSIWLKDVVLDGIGWTIAKNMLAIMRADLINWINSGFKGRPAFVEDLGGLLLEAADQAAGQYIDELGGVGSFICSPFQLDIQIALSLKYQAAREDKPYEGCTLTGIIDNLEGFIEGDFSQGGWDDWIDITSNPEMYTPYGQLLEAQSGLSARLVNEKGQELAQVNWGQGFLSGKICEMIEGPVGPKEKCTISKPGKVIVDALNNNLDTGRETLVTADEINEIIAALFGQLANQALTGAAGLLGLSGGTGRTYSGYSGGSYVNAMVQDSNTMTNDSLDSGTNILSDSLTVQEDYNALAVLYIPQLAAVAADASSTNQAAAGQAYSDAIAVRGKTEQDITILNSLNSEYQNLSLEYSLPSTSETRKNAIQIRLSEITVEYNQLGAYTRESVTASQANWSALVSG